MDNTNLWVGLDEVDNLELATSKVQDKEVNREGESLEVVGGAQNPKKFA